MAIGVGKVPGIKVVQLGLQCFLEGLTKFLLTLYHFIELHVISNIPEK